MVGTLAQGLARIGIPILVGRLSGQAALGQVGLVLAVVVLLSMVWPAPAGTAASRYMTTDAESSRVALRTLRFSTSISLVVVAVAAFVITLVSTRSIELSALALFAGVTYSAYFFARGIFLGRFKARRLATWEVIGAVVAVAGTVSSLLLHAWPGALFSLAIGYLVIAAVGWPWKLGRPAPLEFGVLLFTLRNTIANAASNGMVQLAMVVAFAVSATTTETGYFTAAFSLATPASLLGQTLNQVLIPNLAEQHALAEPKRRPLVLAAAKLIALTAVPFAAVFLLAPVVIPIVYGPKFGPSVEILQTLVVAMFLFTIALYPAAALTAWGRPGLLIIANVSALVLGLGTMIALGVAYGPAGTAFGVVLGTAVMFVLTAVLTLRVLSPRRAAVPA